MRIKTRLRLNTIVILAIMGLMVASVIWAFLEAERADRNQALVVEMERISYERVELRDEYILRHEERAGSQWAAKTEQLRRLLDQAGKRLTKSPERLHLEEIRAGLEGGVLLFSKLMESYRQRREAGNVTTLASEEEKRLFSKIIVGVYDMNTALNSLRESVSRTSAAAQKRAAVLVICFMSLAVAVTVGNSFFITRVLTKRIAQLRRGARAVGAGDLDHHISVTGDDELADLARANNAMAERLKASYTSVSNLEKEVAFRKQAEEALRGQFRFLQSLTDTIPNPVFYKNKDGIYLGCNRAFEEYVGLPKDRIVGRTVREVHPDEVAEMHLRKDRELFAHPGTQIYDTVIEHSSGVRRNIIMSKATYGDTGGAVAGLIGVMVDITDRKNAEERLRESERQLRQIIDLVPHMIFVKDHEGTFLLVNRAVAEGYGTTVDEVEGRSHAEFHPEPHELRRMVEDDREVMEKGEVRHVEEQPYTDSFGCTRILQATKVPFYASNHVKAVLGVAVDITARKQAEEQMKSALKDKEVLLKEIHHRVKNNLQVISSLLKLQTHYLSDPKALDAFTMSMDRIKTMALVHDKLYRSEDLSSIYFPGYAEELARNLVGTYAVGKDITLDLEIEPCSFDIDTAIPLGLLINELVSNALKHGFPGQDRGIITIGLRREGAGFTLTVADTGIGFPTDIDFTCTESLGMQLVITLVEQLDGTIELFREKGTKFRITFPMAG